MSDSMAGIHPSAIISREAELAPDVQVAPFAIIEGQVKLGPGCVVGPHAHLIGPLTLGRNNRIGNNAVIGAPPQHLKYNGEPTGVEIGDDNIFRENVTVHRATDHSWVTRIGSGNLFMVGCHVAHDCRIGNRVIMANGALLAGHCDIGDGVYLSGNCGVHQFVRLGRLAMLSGCSSTTKDIPPFLIVEGRNHVRGINMVGMRRAGMRTEELSAIRRAFHIVFMKNLSLPNALAQIEHSMGGLPVIREFVEFIRASKRGIGSAGQELTEAAA
jgi:UDP-N-acetylglucosamine acyltransferase